MEHAEPKEKVTPTHHDTSHHAMTVAMCTNARRRRVVRARLDCAWSWLRRRMCRPARKVLVLVHGMA
jgi:hypothetical protein